MLPVVVNITIICLRWWIEDRYFNYTYILYTCMFYTNLYDQPICNVNPFIFSINLDYQFNQFNSIKLNRIRFNLINTIDPIQCNPIQSIEFNAIQSNPMKFNLIQLINFNPIQSFQLSQFKSIKLYSINQIHIYIYTLYCIFRQSLEP